MQSNDIDNKIADIFSTLFNREIASDMDFSKEDQDDWDSIKHIEIIMTLEDELGISFDAEDIPTLTSLASILAKVKELS